MCQATIDRFVAVGVIESYGYLSRKVSFWLFKIFEIQKYRTFRFNDILRLCAMVVDVAILHRE